MLGFLCRMEDECAAPVLPEDDEVLDSNPLLYASFQSQRSKVLKVRIASDANPKIYDIYI